MKLTIKMDMDNSAFYHLANELPRIFDNLARKARDGHMHAPGANPILDSNGNTVGHVTITESD